MCAGVLGLSAFKGIIFWMLVGILVTALLVIKIKAMGSEPNGTSLYFRTLYQTVAADMFSNIMTYMIFWILLYNIVYVV